MAWVRIDDNFFGSSKMRAAGKDGRALYIAGLCHCAQNLSDGFVTTAALPLLAAAAEVRPQRTVLTLVEIGAWDVVPGGWMIHDYLDYQPSRAQVLAERERVKARVRRFRNGGGNAVTNGVSNGDETPLVTVPPSHPIPSTSSSRDPSTTSTGVPGVVVAEAVAIYVEADVLSRSVTAIQNAASYREVTANNCYARRGAEIAAYLERRPDATAHDIATVVLGVDEFTARQIARKREAS